MQKWIAGVLVAAAAALGGCDGEAAVDGGVDAFVASGVVMTVSGATAAEAVGGVRPRDGFQYYVLDVTLEARGVGPISVAPVAFSLSIEGDALPVTADNDRTGAVEGGCRSQMVPADGSLSCQAIFVVPVDAGAPTTLRWADARYMATAPVPPLATM